MSGEKPTRQFIIKADEKFTPDFVKPLYEAKPVSTDKLELHIGDNIQTPVGILIVEDLEDSNLRDAYIYLAGCGFTWNGTATEFRKNKFRNLR